MQKLLAWIASHKLPVFLLFVIVLLLVRPMNRFFGISSVGGISTPAIYRNESTTMDMEVSAPSAGGAIGKSIGSSIAMPRPVSPVAPTTSVNRMVVKDTTLSLKVNDVSDTVQKIEASATSFGGYLVNSNVSVPEGASSGSIEVRVPSEKRTEALEQFKSFGVKTVSEYVSGHDVTDQYVDNEERLRILESTKDKFEAILDNAVTVNEMLTVQRELLNLQQQIDNIKGQQQYVEGTTKLTRISVYLSTDELALPYAPVQSWRPGVVLKEAVRSLMMNVRSVLSLLIWVAVYLPAVIVVIVLIAILRAVYQRMRE